MLRIDLKPGEKVRIGDNVTVTLEEKSGQRARLAFQAPREVKIIKLAVSKEILAARGGIVR